MCEIGGEGVLSVFVCVCRGCYRLCVFVVKTVCLVLVPFKEAVSVTTVI